MKKRRRIKWGNVTKAIIITTGIIIGINKIMITTQNESENKPIESGKAVVIGNTTHNEEKPLTMEINHEIDLCSTSNVKSYMNYKMITSKSSDQYRYIQANMKVNEKGMLEDEEGYIGVALGSYFGDIGTKYIVNLDTGIDLKVVKVEAKDDNHTNNGCYQKWDKSVIEFVIDTETAEEYYGVETNGYIVHGNFNNIDEYRGNIERMEVVK